MTAREDSASGKRAGYPRVFGKYLLLAPLGEGGMGEVHLAKHTGLAGIERYCVIKTLRPQHENSGEHHARFMDEARTAVQLNHRNICGVTDVGEVDETMFLAMDYIAGRDLSSVRKALARNGRALSAPIALFIAHELLDALDYAHRLVHPATGEALGVIHRDVSPQNAMVSFEGEVKLIDFGLAASKLKTENTGVGSVMGKIAYMAPEHARGNPLDPSADQFAVAVMVYEMVTGSRYYDGMNQLEVWEVVGRGDHLPKHWDSVDTALARVLARALSPRPEDRYGTCADFRRALEGYQRAHAGFVGADALRALMTDIFPDARKKQREMFVGFEKLASLPERHDDPSEAATMPVPLARVIEMPVSSEGAPLVGDDDLFDASSLNPSEATEEFTNAAPISGGSPIQEFSTSVVSARTQLRQRRTGLAFGVGGAVVLMAAVGVGLLLRGDPPASPEALPVLTEVAPPPTPAPAAAEPAPEPEPEPAVVAEPAPEPPPAPKPATRKPSARKPKAKPKPKPIPAPPPVASSAPPRPTAPLKRMGDKVRFLREHCRARVPCANVVLGQAAKLGDLDVVQVRDFNTRLDACVVRCQR